MRRTLSEFIRFLQGSTLEACRKMEKGSFGAAYAEFMDRRNFLPNDRPPVRFIDDPEVAYVVTRYLSPESSKAPSSHSYRQVHDLWHVLCGCPTNMMGEIAVKAVEGIQVRGHEQREQVSLSDRPGFRMRSSPLCCRPPS